MPGYGTVLGWIFDRLPSKKESLRNKIQKIKEEMDEISSKKFTHKSIAKYDRLADKLHFLERKVNNI